MLVDSPQAAPPMEDESTLAPPRPSLDTSVNINEDVTMASDYSSGSRPRHTESVFSSLRQSLDGSSSHINSFNILKQGVSSEDDPASNSASKLGPNSIYDLTIASDAARVKSNRALKGQVSINGGSTTVYNLLKPSTKDIPPIQLSSLQKKVSQDAFTESLVQNLDKEYKSFESSYNSLTADVLSDFSKSYSAQVSPNSLDGDASDDENTIPAIFESSNFRLDDQRVFRQVMQDARILADPDASDATQLVNNTEVQEKLSHYLDVVEVELIEEISKTSDSFFATLSDIQDIKSQSKDCIDQVHQVKAKIEDIETHQADIGLEILGLLDERRNVNHLESSLLQLKEIISKSDEAEALFQANKHIDCLNTIIIAENLVAGVEYDAYSDLDTLSAYPRFSYPLVDYTFLPALRGRTNKLKELKEACCRGYITDFASLLVTDLRTHYESVSETDTINRIYSSIDRSRTYDATKINKSYTDVSADMKARLEVFVKNLSKSGFLIQAFTEYQTRIIAEIKSIIRIGLPSGNEQGLKDPKSSYDSQPSSNPFENGTPLPQENPKAPHANIGTLSSNIRDLSNTDFNKMMKAIFANLSECLRRLTIHQKLLLDISLTSLTPEVSNNIDVMSLDISVAINKAIEITQVRLVKILNVRSEQLGDCSLSDYLHLYSLSLAYLSECEFINPGYNASGPGSSFNEWVRNHVGYYIHRFHSNSVKQLAVLCDREVWKEFSGEELQSAQETLDVVLSHAQFVENGEGFDGTQWSKQMLSLYSDQAEEKSQITRNEEAGLSSTKIRVGEKSFFVPYVIVKVINVTSDYIILSRIFSSRASTTVHNLLTYLKVLNSRISQAILNAGATRTAGLKHITTKHLALCIQTVDFLITYSSRVSVIFGDLTLENPSASTVEELTFSKTIENFKDHKNELFSKCISIMRDRTTNHCSTIKTLDLSKPISHPQQCHQYMEVLVKETLTVAKVLGRYLDEVDANAIMSQIFENYKKLLVACYCTELPQLKDFNEKHSLLKDVDFFRVKLSETIGYGHSGQVIWENVNSLPTVEDTKMEEVMRANIANERAAAEDSKPTEKNGGKNEEKPSEAANEPSNEERKPTETTEDEKTFEKVEDEKPIEASEVTMAPENTGKSATESTEAAEDSKKEDLAVTPPQEPQESTQTSSAAEKTDNTSDTPAVISNEASASETVDKENGVGESEDSQTKVVDSQEDGSKSPAPERESNGDTEK